MKKKIVVIDGQGGKIGSLLIEQLKKKSPAAAPPFEVFAIGTNSIATSAMLKAGADYGATGENPAVINSRDADIIVGPIGIVVADSLLGEITPAIAVAVGQSAAQKVLLPLNRCNNHIAGVADQPISELVPFAVHQVQLLLEESDI